MTKGMKQAKTQKTSKKTAKKTSKKTTKKTQTEKKTYLEKLKEETDKIFRRRDMKSSEELLQVFSASHSPHNQLRPASSNESYSN